MSRSKFVKNLKLRTKRKRGSLRVSKEQHIVFYPIQNYNQFTVKIVKMDMLTVSFFFPLIAQRVQLSRFKTSTSVHCCAEIMFFYGSFQGKSTRLTRLTVDDIVVDLEET